MQYSVRQKQPAFNNAEKGTTNETLSLVLTTRNAYPLYQI